MLRENRRLIAEPLRLGKRARSSRINLACLNVARSKIDESMIRRIISEIDPTYAAAC